MFEPFAMRQIGLFTGIQGDTRAKYRRMVERNMAPWFRSCSVWDGEGGINREMVQRWVNDLAAGTLAPHDPKDRRPRTKCKPKTVARPAWAAARDPPGGGHAGVSRVRHEVAPRK